MYDEVGSLVYRVYFPDQAAACSAPPNQPSTGVTETDRHSGGPPEPSLLRCWSMCNGSVMPTGATDTIGCLYDEQVVTGLPERSTIVVSTPEDRPGRASFLRVTWMPWDCGPRP